MTKSEPKSPLQDLPTFSPLLWPPESFRRWILNNLTIRLIKLIYNISWFLRRSFIPLTTKYPTPPTLVKSYPSHPKLKHRIFYPTSYTPGSTYPLYINIHGGGFALGSPANDDQFCHLLATRFNFLVISIAYPLAPQVQFPVPTYAIGDIVSAILSDESLPLEASKVAIGGFSAGGNLALSACQLEQLQGKIKAVVAWYAPVDWSVNLAYKLTTRTYPNPKDVDGLKLASPFFNHAYLKPGQDQRDPLLSILYAEREKLPEWIWAIGAEFDMLQDEARRMMGRFAGMDLRRVEGSVDVVMADGERVGFERDGGRLRWTLVSGVRHAFTHWWMKKERVGEKVRPMAEKLFAEVGEWLVEGAFADSDK